MSDVCTVNTTSGSDLNTTLSTVIHPALEQGENANASLLSLGPDFEKNVARLYTDIKRSTEHARKAYWAVTCWNTLTWQPVYLSVYAVHVLSQVPDFKQLQQHQLNGAIYGYQWQKNGFEFTHKNTVENEKLNLAAQQLIYYLEQTYLALTKICLFRQSLAKKHILDRVLFGCLRLGKAFPDRQVNIEQLFGSWRSALAMIPSSQFALPYKQLPAQRQACCLHYSVMENDYCCDCPRHPNKMKN